MKKLVGILSIICFTVISVNAQKPSAVNGHRNFHGRHRRPDIARQLDFTDAQKQQLKAQRMDFQKKMQDLNKNESITVKEMRDQRAALLKEQKTAFENLLTPEQKTKMADLKKQAMAKKEAMEAKRLDKMKTQLGLTDEQTASIKNLNQDFRDKMKKLHEDNTIERTSKREQAMVLLQQHKKDLEGIFTTDQLNKFKEFRKDRMDKRM